MIRNLYDSIFQDIKSAINYLTTANVLLRTIKCNCDGFMQHAELKKYAEGKCFYCANGGKKRKQQEEHSV